MNLLVIGGTGFISGVLVKMLLADGHRVTVVSRGKTTSPFKFKGDIHFHYADRRLPPSMQETVDRQTYYAVFDMVAYEPEESRLAAQIFRQKVGRFIHRSTCSVYMVSEEICVSRARRRMFSLRRSRRGRITSGEGDGDGISGK